jgi:cysteine desulfurase/selenocysteine lyase
MTESHTSSGFAVEGLRADFPILAEKTDSGKPIVYLDSAATSQTPEVVVEAIRTYYHETNANVHRGMHHLAEKATSEFEGARQKIANFLNAPSHRNVIFTRGTTESINLVAHGWGRKFIQEGDEIILTVMEHHSNIVPWQMLAQEKGAVLKYIPIKDDATLDLDVFKSLISERTKLVSVTHVSNALGTVNPIEEIIATAHAAGAKVLIDSAQGTPHMTVDVQALDADFLAFSAHKLCGPTGFGVLYGKEDLLEEMNPFLGGGEMIHKVELDHSSWADLPYKFEAGTPHICGAIATGVAIDYIQHIGLDAIHHQVNALTEYAIDRLSGIENMTIYSQAPERGGAVAFNYNGIHSHDLSQIVNEEGVAIRAGHVCCQPLMAALGVAAISRASFYFYNTRDEIDALIDALATVKKIFRL